MANILKLRMVLKDIRPIIWRRVEVDDSMTFEDLHLVIQGVMGWENCHLYDFRIGNEIRLEGNLDESLVTCFPGESRFKTFDPMSTVLSDFIKREKEKFTYTYDFGDNWQVEIAVNAIVPKKEGSYKAICISGKRNAPPEDSGGSWGYEYSLEVLKEKNHPEYNDRMEWFGEDFDPEYFNLKEINKKITDSSFFIQEFDL